MNKRGLNGRLLSRCCFQSEIVLEQLALHKPPPPGPEKYRNFPLLLALIIMVVGLVIVLANLTENKKTSLLVKCVGPGLVMVGLIAILLRILFTYEPTIWNRRKKKKEISKANVTNSQNSVINDTIEMSNLEHCCQNTRVNLRERKPKSRISYENSVSAGNTNISDGDSFLSSIELENMKIRKGDEKRKENNEEVKLTSEFFVE